MLLTLHASNALHLLPDFFDNYKWDGRPFLLAGMGPSFSRVHSFKLDNYNVLGINKVVREIHVDICSIIDYYIVDKVADSIDKQAKYLVMPYFPHFSCRPFPQLNIGEATKNLKKEIKDKLLCYNLSTIRIKVNKSPTIFAYYFTAEASLNLIAQLGCKEVKAIGIDGGLERANEFSDHGPIDPRGFDMQWEGMAKTIARHGINYSNLDGSPLNPKLEKLLESHIHRV